MVLRQKRREACNDACLRKQWVTLRRGRGAGEREMGKRKWEEREWVRGIGKKGGGRRFLHPHPANTQIKTVWIFSRMSPPPPAPVQLSLPQPPPQPVPSGFTCHVFRLRQAWSRLRKPGLQVLCPALGETPVFALRGTLSILDDYVRLIRSRWMERQEMIPRILAHLSYYTYILRLKRKIIGKRCCFLTVRRTSSVQKQLAAAVDVKWAPATTMKVPTCILNKPTLLHCFNTIRWPPLAVNTLPIAY